MMGRSASSAPKSALDRVHLVGIGGAGMSGIARILLDRGMAVSGSDAKESPTLLTLRAQGARVAVGQAAANLDLLDGGPTAVVVSTAIKPDNPELVEAQTRGLTVLHRSEALAALMADHRVACVAGTHGKTSTTSMLTVALQHCRLDPSFAIGGDLNESGANAHHGVGGIFVAEADESDGSFLAFAPSIAVVTNVEADHLDHHGTVEAYNAGLRVLRGPHRRRRRAGRVRRRPGFRRAGAARRDAGRAGAALRPRGGGRDADRPTSRSTAAGSRGSCWTALPVAVRVAVPGEHMALNALGALVAGLELGAPLDGLLEGIAGFGGVRRRFEFKGRAGGVRVYDDYAHHPTEVAAQLRAARPAAHGGKLVVIFQPHLYSRTRLFTKEFGAALALADEVVVLDVYGAREQPEPGVNGQLDRGRGAAAGGAGAVRAVVRAGAGAGGEPGCARATWC